MSSIILYRKKTLAKIASVFLVVTSTSFSLIHLSTYPLAQSCFLLNQLFVAALSLN